MLTQFRNTTWPTHVFGLWEEARGFVPTKAQREHATCNTESPAWGWNQDLFALAVALTTTHLNSVALTGWYICQGSDTDLFTETNVFFWAISETFWVNYRLFAGKPLCAALFLIVLKTTSKCRLTDGGKMRRKSKENKTKWVFSCCFFAQNGLQKTHLTNHADTATVHVLITCQIIREIIIFLLQRWENADSPVYSILVKFD